MRKTLCNLTNLNFFLFLGQPYLIFNCHSAFASLANYAIEKKKEKVIEAHKREFCEMTGNLMFPHVIKRHKNL